MASILVDNERSICADHKGESIISCNGTRLKHEWSCQRGRHIHSHMHYAGLFKALDAEAMECPKELLPLLASAADCLNRHDVEGYNKWFMAEHNARMCLMD